jgi:hypothetical protein
MVEKIDVINGVIYTYDENMEQIKSISLDTLEDLDLSYLDGCKLLTINISQPVKRVVKFSELQGLETDAVFVETLYENMTEQQALDFNNFVALINSLL